MSNASDLKNFLSRVIFTGAIGALVAFGYSLSVSKLWRVTGKIVVVPSGSSPTAGANLFVEAANTAEMVSSPSFQKNILEDKAKFFSNAEQFQNSSTVEVNFVGREDDLEAIEEAIAKLPEGISFYARDIYGGSPFKYLLVGDPEISSKPVKPDIIKNVLGGGFAGAVLYFLYWLYIEPLAAGRRTEKEKEIFSVTPPVSAERVSTKPVSSSKSASKPEVVPESTSEAVLEKETEKEPASRIGSVPDNLPVSEAPAISEYQEPSDEEVKERLNRLMRGEL